MARSGRPNLSETPIRVSGSRFRPVLPLHWRTRLTGRRGSPLQCPGRVSHQGVDRRRSNPVQEHPVQPSTQRASMADSKCPRHRH
jgi:hypothetical protein